MGLGLKAGFHALRKTFLRTGTDRKVSFMLEPLVPTESSQDKGNFPVRSRPEENFPEWKPAFRNILIKFQASKEESEVAKAIAKSHGQRRKGRTGHCLAANELLPLEGARKFKMLGMRSKWTFCQSMPTKKNVTFIIWNKMTG